MAAHGLTENHERGLLASVQYVGQLVRQCEEILAASDRPGPLNRYTGSRVAARRVEQGGSGQTREEPRENIVEV